MFNTSNSGYSLADVATVLGGSRDGLFGGNGGGIWWILLFVLFFAGGWGNGFGFGGNGSRVGADLTYSFDTNSTHEGIRDLAAAVTSGFYNINTGLLNGLSGVTAAVTNGVNDVRTDICNLGYTNLQNTNTIMGAINADTIANMQNTFGLSNQINALSQQSYNCCCETQRALDKDFAELDYNLATLACDTKQAVLDSTRTIVEAGNNNTRAILDFLTQDRISALQAENTALKNAASQAEQNAYLVSKLSPSAAPAYIVANPYTGVIYPQNVPSYANYGQFGYGCGCSA